MAGTAFTDLAFFTGATGGNTSCDSTTDWTGYYSLDTEMMIQGTGCLTMKVSNTTAYATFTVADPGTNVTGKLVVFWAKFVDPIGRLALKSGGGVGLRLEDAAGNYAEWFVAGRDTWAGDWKPFAVHMSQTPDAQSATPPNLGAVKYVKIRFTTVATIKVTPNCYFDAIRFGTYVGVKGGTETDPATLDDILTAEAQTANKWGILSKFEGVIYAQGNIRIGSTTAGEATYFKDRSKILVFTDRPYPSDFYEIRFQGNATADTKIYFGDKVGGKGISGLYIASANPGARFALDATDTNVGYFGLYGTIFFQARRISLPSYSVNKEVISCNFEKCWEVYGSTTTIKFCNFISPSGETPARAYRMVSGHPSGAGRQITDSNFISCERGVEIPETGTFTFDALKFSGNTYDIDNTSGGAVTVNCVNGSNPTTYTGNTTIVNVVYVTVDVVDKNLNPISNAQVWVYNLTDGTVIMNQATDANGRAQTTVNYTGDKSLEVRVRKSTPPATRYIPVVSYGTLTSTGFTTKITLYEDTTL